MEKEPTSTPSFCQRLKLIDFRVAICVWCFALSSWIDIQGVWIQLPILVNKLPEGWSLPSYIVVLIQCSVVVPLLYGILSRWKAGQKGHLEVVMSYFIMIVGFLSLVFLQFFWDATVFIAGSERSLASLVLIFLLSMVDTTSSVVYLPYMARFKPQYIPALVAGEESSGLIAGTIGLIQGASGESHCINKTVQIFNETLSKNYTESVITMVSSEPRFSVSVFFGILAIIMGLSLVSFSLLNFAPFAQKELAPSPDDGYNKLPVECEKAFENCHSQEIVGPELGQQKPIDKMSYVVMLFYFMWSSVIAYGVFPSIQAFSTLPYGALTFTLAICLPRFSNPLSALASFVCPTRSLKAISFFMAISSGLAAYHLFLASTSPSPPLQQHILGKGFAVS